MLLFFTRCLRVFNYSLTVFLLLFYMPVSFAQVSPEEKVTITGNVVSSDELEPLIGVNILEKGTSKGTITDFNGNYEVVVNSNAILVFKYIGYTDQEISVAGKSVINVNMEPEAELLSDVIVTGYRTEIKSHIASAITSVKAENIEKIPVLGFDQALQGQASGVQITQSTGAPGDDIAVRIRGVGTIGNNNPLYIIDGVPTTGNINMFSTSDIESIEILKDGSAAAIYGSRAANGVIVITTKKGKEGKPQFSFSSFYGMQEANTLPDLFNKEEYVTVRNAAINNANLLRDDRRQLDTFPLTMLDTLPDVNWLDEVFRVAPIQKYQLSAQGGSEVSRYFISGEYLNQEGVFKGQGFKKYLLRFNSEIGDKRFKLGNNMSISFSDRNIIGSSGDGAGPGNELSGIRYALIASPVFSIRDDNGEYINTSAPLGNSILYGDGNANPLAFIEATDWNIKRSRLFGNIFGSYDIIPGLTFRSNLGIDYLIRKEKIFKKFLSQSIYNPTSLSEGRTIEQNLIWNNILNFSKDLGLDNQHHVSALLGTEIIDNKTDYLGASASNFIRSDPAFRYISNSVTEDLSDIGAGGVESEWSLLSYFIQAGYTYKNKYVINAALRRDGSSRFGSANRYGNFPSFSVAWNILNEDFMPQTNILSNLKLRYSWGKLGNQEIGIYPFSSLVRTGQISYIIGGIPVTGAQIVETGNEDIKWETTTQTNYGLDIGLFNDRISLQLDYYKKISEDILVRVPLPEIAGDVTPSYINAGEVENKGLEIALGYNNRIGAFKYNISANLATFKNKVIAIADSEPILGGFGLSDGAITKTEPGYPIGSFFLYQKEGIFQSQDEIDNSPFQSDDTRPGDIKFADLNGDNIIDDKDRDHLGNPFPDFIYGLSASLTYKDIDFSILLQGVQGNDVYFLYGNFAYETPSRGFNSYRDLLDYWSPQNTDAVHPKVSLDDKNGNRRVSTRFLEDGSFMKVRNITVGYNFDNLIKKAVWLKSARLYFSVQNAFTFTNYSGLDPEIQANTNDTKGYNVSSDLAVGIDWGTVPSPRTMIVGFSIDF